MSKRRRQRESRRTIAARCNNADSRCCVGARQSNDAGEIAKKKPSVDRVADRRERGDGDDRDYEQRRGADREHLQFVELRPERDQRGHLDALGVETPTDDEKRCAPVSSPERGR